MPWKENEDGSLARGDDGNPIWVNEAGLETAVDYVWLTKRLAEASAEIAARGERARELEARLAPLVEAGIDDIPAFLEEARDAIGTRAPDRDRHVEDQARLDAAIAPLKREIAAKDRLLEEERRKTADVTARYHAVLVKSEVLNSALLKERVVPDVRPFLERELTRAGSVENDRVVFRDARGGIIRGDAGEPAGVDEAAVAIIRSLGLDPARVLLSTSRTNGSDATAGASPGERIGNPWAGESWNVTAQMELYASDPAEAARLMRAANLSVPGF